MIRALPLIIGGEIQSTTPFQELVYCVAIMQKNKARSDFTDSRKRTYL